MMFGECLRNLVCFQLIVMQYQGIFGRIKKVSLKLDEESIARCWNLD
jgi:hypothetical protein